MAVESDQGLGLERKPVAQVELGPELPRVQRGAEIKKLENREPPNLKLIEFFFTPEANGLQTQLIQGILQRTILAEKDSFAKASANPERLAEFSSATVTDSKLGSVARIGKLISLSDKALDVKENVASPARARFQLMEPELQSILSNQQIAKTAVTARNTTPINPDLDHERYVSIVNPTQEFMQRLKPLGHTITVSLGADYARN